MGLLKKEAQKLHVDARKDADLEVLRAQGGPFVNPDEIDAYLVA